jgi:hypothetical protein
VKDNYQQQVKIIIISKGEGMKKFLAICLVLVTVLAIALPSMVLADNTAVVNGTVAATPVLSSISGNTHGLPHTATVGGPVTVSGIILTGSSFESEATVTIDGSGVNYVSCVVNSDTQITAVFSLDAAAAAGTRVIHVTQGGKTSVNTAVTFLVDNYINVTAPSAVDLGVLDVTSAHNKAHSGTAGSVDTNLSTGFKVIASDLKGTNTGYMVSTGTPLHYELQVSNADSGYAAAHTGHEYDNVTTLPFYVDQQGYSTDAAGSYSITITFVGSVQ